MFGSLFKPKLQVNESVDEFSGLKSYLVRKNRLAADSAAHLGIRCLEMNPAKFVHPEDPVPTYVLSVTYAGEEWAFLERGLIFLLDGDSLEVLGAEDPTREVEEEGVFETALYEVSAEELHRIAGANDVRVRILGEDMSFDCSFSPANSHVLREFVSRYVHGSTGDPAPAVPRASETRAADAPPPRMKECPMCAEHVKARAKICRFCRHEFS